MTIDMDLMITSWNAGAEELYGYSAKEVIGKRMTMLTLPKELETILSNVEKIKETKRVEIYDSERVSKSGRLMILEILLSPVKDDAGQIIGMSAVARDMTERRRAETALREKEALRNLVIAQDAERKRISRNVHDNIGQQLTALNSVCREPDSFVRTYLRASRWPGLSRWLMKSTEASIFWRGNYARSHRRISALLPRSTVISNNGRATRTSPPS